MKKLLCLNYIHNYLTRRLMVLKKIFTVTLNTLDGWVIIWLRCFQHWLSIKFSTQIYNRLPVPVKRLNKLIGLKNMYKMFSLAERVLYCGRISQYCSQIKSNRLIS